MNKFCDILATCKLSLDFILDAPLALHPPYLEFCMKAHIASYITATFTYNRSEIPHAKQWHF